MSRIPVLGLCGIINYSCHTLVCADQLRVSRIHDMVLKGLNVVFVCVCVWGGGGGKLGV